MKLITDGDFKIFMESLEIKYPNRALCTEVMLRFWSRWENSKNPDDLHKQFECVLDGPQLDTLIAELTEIRRRVAT